jgi:hypothetical protein
VTYNLGPVKPWVQAAANELGGKFGISSIGGYRASAKDQNGHPAGRALDLMVSDVKRGTALAEYARANARRLGVEYVIWRQRIWSVARNGEGWRPMEDRGSPTQNHMDHVHVNFNATAPAGGGAVVDTPTPTWKPNQKRLGAKPGDRGNGRQNGAQPASDVAAAGAGGLLGGIGDGIRGLAIVGACLFGGTALIALGAAATARSGAKKITDSDQVKQAEQVVSLLPQGKAAKAATAATATKGTR